MVTIIAATLARCDNYWVKLPQPLESDLCEGVGTGLQACDKALVPRRRKWRAAHQRIPEAVIEGSQPFAANVELGGIPAALIAGHLHEMRAVLIAGAASELP